MISTLISIAITLIYVLACLFLGLILIKLMLWRWPIINLNLLGKLASGFMLGQGILASTWLLLGLGSVFSKSIIWSIIILILLFGIIILRSSFQKSLAKIKEKVKKLKQLSLIWKIIFLFVIALILSYGVWSFVNLPAGDAEGFYMVLPKVMASARKLRPLPNTFDFSQIGLSGEMHFAALMSIADSAAAQLFIWFTAIAATMFLLAICSMLQIKVLGQIVALIILFSSSTFTLYLSGGKVDVFGAAFGLAAYFWVLEAYRQKKVQNLALVLSGLFLGFNLVAKFPNAATVLPGLFLIIIWNNYSALKKKIRNIFPKIIYPFLIVIAFFLLAIIPHLIKNWFLFNEPLAPFIFIKSAGAKWLDQSWFSSENIHFILKTYPIALTYGQYPMQGGNISFLLLAFAPLIVFSDTLKTIAKTKFFQILAMVLIGILFWILFRPGVMAPRYILPTLLLAIPLVAKIVDDIFTKSRFLILKIVIILSFLIVLLSSTYSNYAQIRQALIMGKANFQKYGRFSAQSSEFLDQKVAKGERVFMAGYYVYFLRPDILQCLSTQSERDDQAFKKQSPEVWSYLYDQGFKYMVVQKVSFPDALKSWDINKKPDWLGIKEIYSDPSVIIYSLEGTKPDQTPQCDCTSLNDKAWDVRCLSGAKK
ncbi:MAG: hypothetical protein M1429_01375 [Patescibacteria group bacterium]|nr:hypothetical protein [Patescibacteria group bacterium]